MTGGRRLATALAALAALAPAAATARAAAPSPPRLAAPEAIVVESSSGRPVFALDAGRRRPIASTTKMMTALVVRSALRLTHVCTAPPYAAQPAESQIGLRAGERMTVHDLLQALMLPSANDAAAALAVCAAGSRGAFVARMNARAAALGLRRTRFSTPIGLDGPGNYSSAADLARLALALRRDGFLRRTMDLPRALLRSGERVRRIVNRNTLVLRVPWVDGVKTGHTLQAGYVLVASGTRRGLTFVAAVLDDPSEAARDDDALALLRWAFASFRMAAPVTRGAVYARPAVRDDPGVRAELVAARSVHELLPRGARVRLEVRAPERIAGPLPRGTRAGTLIVREGSRAIAHVALLTRRAVPAVGPLARVARAVAAPGSLIAIAAMLGGGAATLLASRRRRAARRRRADMEAA